MTLDEFARTSSLSSAGELDRVRLLAYFHHKTAGKTEFSLADIATWFSERHLAEPNKSRLRSKLLASRSFIRGSSPATYRLHAVDLGELQSAYPGIHVLSEEVVSGDALLPRSLYDGTRGFVEALASQINAAYEYNIFDGCAVLMRRLAEVLLILSYENHNIEGEILDGNGNYMLLERIVANAKANSTLKLSRNTKNFLDQFRMLGNFAAHKIYFNTRRGDVQGQATEYRAMIEELMYKAGVRR